jgi:type IV secretion system protein VirB5
VPEGDNKTPFNPLTRYDRIIGEQCRESATWRRVAITAMAAFFLAAGILIYAVRLPKTVPLVILVSEWGEAKYSGDISHFTYGNIQVLEIAIQYQLRKFVNNLFTIPGDADLYWRCSSKVQCRSHSICVRI